MSLSENGNGLSAADIAAVTGASGNGAFGWGEGGLFWIIVLFLFAMMGNWGNGFGGGNAQMPYILSNTTNTDIQRGFDQQAIMTGLNGINSTVANGFANAEISRCNSQANILQTLNNNQSAVNANMNNLAMSLQNCCCENRAGLADLKYTVATEACADRQAVTDALTAVTTAMNAGFQGIYNQMCQDKIDSKNEEIANLRTQLSMKDLAASQIAQTSQILANNEAQTAALERYLAPNPVPAYVVQNPNCCNPGYYTGSCGCAAA